MRRRPCDLNDTFDSLQRGSSYNGGDLPPGTGDGPCLDQIFLSRDADSKSVKARLKTACDGELVNVLAVPDSRFKLLRVTKATAKRRDLARQDRAVRTVGKVFGFAGSPGPALAFGRQAKRLRPRLKQFQERRFVETHVIRLRQKIIC